MRQSAENQLKNVVSVIAGSVALVIIFVLPAIYFIVQYAHLSEKTQLKANYIADDVSVYIYQHPGAWMYHEHRVKGFLEKYLDLKTEEVKLQSDAIETGLGAGEAVSNPILSKSSTLTDGISVVGRITVSTSLYSVYLNTLYAFFLGLFIGLIIFSTLYFWPLRILTQSIEQLDDVRQKLEYELNNKEKLLLKSDNLMKNLRRERNFTDTVYEVASNVIVVFDLAGNVILFNRAAEELTGYSRDEVLGEPVWDFVIPKDQVSDVKRFFHSMRTGEVDLVDHFESDWVKRNGEHCTLDWRNSTLLNEEGEITHVVSLGYDVTEHKIEQEQKERLQRELNQSRKMDALGKLTGGIAHDFNNMLGVISGYGDLAVDELENDNKPLMRKYLGHILQSSKRASSLVKQMMLFSRNDPGKSEVVQADKIVNESIKMLRSVLPTSINLKFTVDENIPSIKMDVVQLQQVVMNLCLNARDAMEGEGELTIHLKYKRNLDGECAACHQKVLGNWVELSVSDTGSGIADDDLERIFEPFYTTKAVGKGTGMGLSMIHTIIDSQLGHILISTEKGKGTTFRILLPPHEQILQEEGSGDVVVESKQDYQGQGQNILVVDDEQSLTSFMHNLLEKNNYNCTSCNKSPEALQLFLNEPDKFDVLITDQTMPDLTGINLIHTIRETRPDILAILATGYSDTVSRDDAEKMGIHFINKPFDAIEMLKLVSESLNRNDAGNNKLVDS